MNLAATLAIASTLVAATLAAECDDKIYDAVATTAREKCESESAFDFELSAPSPEIMAKFCKSDACMTVMKDVKALGLPECTILGKQLYKEVLNPLGEACKQAASSGNTNTSAATGGHTHGNSSDKAGASKKPHGSGSMNSSDGGNAVTAPKNHSANTPAPTSPATTVTAVSVSSLVVASVAALSIAAALV